MASRFKFFFDNIPVSEPLNWSDLSVSITRAENGLLIQQDSDVQFAADAYQYLYSKAIADGFCSQVAYKIFEDCSQDGNYEQTDTGIIFISDCEFNLDMCVVGCKLQDDGWYSKINNNKSIETSTSVGKSKLGNTITPVTRFAVEFFIPDTGVYAYNCYCYTVYDAIRYYIDFMSDSGISFESSILDTGGEFEGMCFTTGAELFYQDNNANNFTNVRRSFAEIIETVCRVLNLGWWIERDSANNPVFRLETKSYFYSSNIAFNLNNVKGISKRYAKEKLYATVTLGSSDTNDDVDYTFPENIAFNGFLQEQYQMLSNCNIDANLDLTSNVILSSNVIEAAVTANDDSYNEGLFMVDVDMATLKAVASDWLGTPDVYYNERLNNANVLTRSVGFVPNEIANYLTGVSPLFLAAMTTPLSLLSVLNSIDTVEPVEFDDDFNPPNNDVDDVWNISTYEFTSPLIGLYYFTTRFITNAVSGAGGDFTIFYDVYDESGFAGGNLYSTTNNVAYNPSGGAQIYIDVIQVLIPTNYKLVVRITWQRAIGGTLQISTANIECTGSSIGSGILETNDPSQFPIEIYSFDYPISKDQFDTLKDAPNLQVTVNDGTHYLNGWVDKIEYSRNTGLTKFSLINIST